jgi:ribosomal RNA-processing protein 8
MLYQSNSQDAAEMMRGDPNMFQEVLSVHLTSFDAMYQRKNQYHTGFRSQVCAWPSNPIDHYASVLGSYPVKTVIADLGCGDAALARALIPKGMIVHSYDLVSDGAYVIEADICDKLPLPGSEGVEGKVGEGEGHVVDVAVCALSLMGSNWPKCIREVWRILKPGLVFNFSDTVVKSSRPVLSRGELKIAEVTSRLTDVERFVSSISSIGFKFKSKVGFFFRMPVHCLTKTP